MDNNIDIKNDNVARNDKVATNDKTARIIIISAFILCFFVVAKSLFAVETTSDLDFEIRRIYFASSILTVLASIWIIGLVACVWGPQPADDKEGAGKQAFDTLTKTITPLITMVLVFYFTLSPKPSEPSVLQIDKVSISPENPKFGQPITIKAKVLGGKKPKYTLSFSDGIISSKNGVSPVTEVKGDVSKEGEISEEVSVPIPTTQDVKKDITLTIKVEEGNNKLPDYPKIFTVTK